MAQASTRRRTWPGPGVGGSRSRSSSVSGPPGSIESNASCPFLRSDDRLAGFDDDLAAFRYARFKRYDVVVAPLIDGQHIAGIDGRGEARLDMTEPSRPAISLPVDDRPCADRERAKPMQDRPLQPRL